MSKWLSKLALKTVADVRCPKCGEVYGDISYFETREGELVLICGSCGAEYPHSDLDDLVNKAKEEALNPSEPVAQPPDTRVKLLSLADGSIGLDIPKSGKSGGLLFFAILWLSFCAVFLLIPTCAGPGDKGEGSLIGLYAFMLLFIAIGLGILYFALRMRNSTHHLLVGNGQLRYASQFIGRERLRVYPAKDAKSVRQVVFYSQNNVPIYGIEIEIEGGDVIRFGTQLSEDEKRWIVWEIRNALAKQGQPSILPTSN